MKKLYLILAAVTFLYAADARAQSVPTCESLGYVRTASECTSKGKEALKCPFDSSKVYCGVAACDLVTAVTCSTGCKEYHSTCPSKCKTCTPVDPCIAQYDRLNFNYEFVIQKAQNCGDYVSWNGGRFPIDMNDTCSTFRSRTIMEVNQYNATCGVTYKKITYNPMFIGCSTCCVSSGHNVPALSMCTEDHLI